MVDLTRRPDFKNSILLKNIEFIEMTLFNKIKIQSLIRHKLFLSGVNIYS